VETKTGVRPYPVPVEIGDLVGRTSAHIKPTFRGKVMKVVKNLDKVLSDVPLSNADYAVWSK
jgi:hypothetical protein